MRNTWRSSASDSEGDSGPKRNQTRVTSPSPAVLAMTVQRLLLSERTPYSGWAMSVGCALVAAVLFVAALALTAALIAMLEFTRFGAQVRAAVDNQRMARGLGVDVDRTISQTFVLGAALAGVAGVMVTMYYGVIDFYIGFLAGIKAFTAAVLGGIGSLPGAMLGGLLIGLIEAMWSGYFSIEYKDVATFGILVMVLLFRPTGLLGRPDVEKI